MSDGAVARPAEHVRAHVFEATRGRYRVRAARPGDEAGLRRMLQAAPPEDIRLRFFRHARFFPHAMVEPLTRMDGARHLAFVVTRDAPGAPIVGNAMLVIEPDGRSAEFGIIVARSEANQRLGSHLLDCLVREARGHGCESIYGLILADNGGMIDLARRLGFGIACDLQEPGCVRATLRLDAQR